MKILYLETSPRPAISGTDAVFQEIEALRGKTNGDCLNLFPLPFPTRFVPKSLYGIRSISKVAELNQNYDAFHVYNSQLQVFPYLHRLNKPIIYSVVAGLGSQFRPPSKRDMQNVHTVVVSNERDAAILEKWGIKNYCLIRSGIDTSHFEQSPPPPQSEFTLLVGSAPWTKAQFATKGIDALIDVASKTRDLKLIFLWRGGHLKLLENKITNAGISQQVEIINTRVDVSKLLQRVHATVVLAKSSKLVKAYPHSLMESLAAARPILISQSIPMADYVKENGCGTVVDNLNSSSLSNAIDKLRQSYNDISSQLNSDHNINFSQQRLIDNYIGLYTKIMKDS